ncbi:MAG: DMT family transporter [Verrucomicrobiales bacterium]|nr:DMT family transporter [Verrucomicrobiales bacterium]
MTKNSDTLLPAIPDASSRRGIIVMLLSVTCFTVNTLLLRYLSGEGGGIAPEVPLLFRAAVGMVIVLVFFRGRRPTEVKPVFTNRLLVLRGMTGLLGTAAYYWTVPKMGAGPATIICNTYVIFASVIAVLALGERLTAKRFLWLALSFVGIVLLVGPDGSIGKMTFGFVEMVALLGAIMAAWSVILVRRLVADYSIGTIYLSQCVWIFVPLLVVAGPQVVGLAPAHLGLVLLAGTAAGYGQLAMNEGYRCLSVSAGASMQMLWPVATTVGGMLLFDERFALVQLVGAILILVAVWRVSAKGA